MLPRIPPPAQESALFGALPAAVYMTDAAGRITYYNEAAAHLWGCRPRDRQKRVLRIVETLPAQRNAAASRGMPDGAGA